MSEISMICRSGTPFTADGNLDEEGFRLYLRRFLEAGVGVNVGSGGSGEGHALSNVELGRVYRIAVEECGGKVPVFANPPEQHTVHGAIEHTRIAIEAGIEVVNLYPPAAWHGMKPKDHELVAYYDDFFREIRHPIALSVNPILGYRAPAALVSSICQRYTQIAVLNLFGIPDDYYVQVMDGITRELPIHVPLRGSLTPLAMGARGLVGAEGNLLPRTHRQFVDLYMQGRMKELAKPYADILRFKTFVSRWEPANPRWIKMGMKVFGLGGGTGVLRPPYRNASAEDLKAFTEGLLKLNIPEINDLARATGVA
jgi:4-hydroxy-tetrahydrodipicolinate synthase